MSVTVNGRMTYMSEQVVGEIENGYDQQPATIEVTASVGEFEGLILETTAPSTEDYILTELSYTAACDLITKLMAGVRILWGPGSI